MTEKLKSLSIVIPTHRRPDSVARLLKSVAFQDFDFKTLEVIVVSNLPDRRVEAEVSRYKQSGFCFQYLESGWIGVNRARNKGLKAIRAPIVLFLDDDCLLPDPSYLKKVLIYHRLYPDLAGLGGGYSLAESSSVVDKTYHFIQERWIHSNIESVPYARALFGGNASYKVDPLKKQLYFDDSIDFGGAETELNIRLLNRGFKLGFFPQLNVIHQSKSRLFDFLYKAYKQGYSFERRGGQAYIPKFNLVPWREIPPQALSSHLMEGWLIHHLLMLFETYFAQGRQAFLGKSDLVPTRFSLFSYLIRKVWPRLFFKSFYGSLKDLLYTVLYFAKYRV